MKSGWFKHPWEKSGRNLKSDDFCYGFQEKVMIKLKDHGVNIRLKSAMEVMILRNNRLFFILDFCGIRRVYQAGDTMDSLVDFYEITRCDVHP